MRARRSAPARAARPPSARRRSARAATAAPPAARGRSGPPAARRRARALGVLAHAAASCPRPPPVIATPSSSSRRVRRELTDDLALVDDEDPVGEREDLLELERDEQDAPPLVALLDEPPVDELDRADVEPARRLRGDQDARVAVDLAREHDLLLVAAGEPAARASAARRRGRRNSLISCAARSTGDAGKSQPNLESGARRKSWRAMFSAIENSSTRPRRCRSSGMWPSPAVKWPRALSCGHVLAGHASPCPARSCAGRVIASISSVCPLPSMPARPTISPARTSSERPRTFSIPRSSKTCRSSTVEQRRRSGCRRPACRRAAAPRGRPSAARGPPPSHPPRRASRSSSRGAAP